LVVTGWRENPDSVGITLDEAFGGDPLGVAGGAPVPRPEGPGPALSPEMRAFLNAHVDRKSSVKLELQQLVSSIMDAHTFG